MAAELDIAPSATATRAAVAAAAEWRRGGWIRRMYSPVGAEQWTSPRAAAGTAPASPAGGGAGADKPIKPGARRGGWLRRLVARKDQHALGWRWTKLSAASSKLAAGLRWKRMPGISFGGNGGGGCASAVLDAVSFHVMYVVEAVVLGLALSCFFCCCGCQI